MTYTANVALCSEIRTKHSTQSVLNLVVRKDTARLWKVNLNPEGPATGHLGTGFYSCFPVSESKCWDGSQFSKLTLHASNVALPK
jgi:hypothetical protein